MMAMAGVSDQVALSSLRKCKPNSFANVWLVGRPVARECFPVRGTQRQAAAALLFYDSLCSYYIWVNVPSIIQSRLQTAGLIFIISNNITLCNRIACLDKPLFDLTIKELKV